MTYSLHCAGIDMDCGINEERTLKVEDAICSREHSVLLPNK